MSELEDRFAGKGYGEFKSELADVVIHALAPIRRRYTELIDDVAQLERLLADGAGRAAAIAAETMEQVRQRAGLLPRTQRESRPAAAARR